MTVAINAVMVINIALFLTNFVYY